MAEPTAADKVADRRLTLLVGLIAGGSAVLGGAVGGVSGYMAARQNAKSTAEQAQVEFFRTQRQLAYSQYYTNFLHVSTVVGSSAFPERGVPTTADCGALLRERQELNDLLAGYTAILFIGSPEVRLALDPIHEIYKMDRTAMVRCVADDAEQLVGAIGATVSAEEIADRVNAFTDAVREEFEDN